MPFFQNCKGVIFLCASGFANFDMTTVFIKFTIKNHFMIFYVCI